MPGISADKPLVPRLPLGGDDAQKHEVSGSHISDELPGPGWDKDDLPWPDKGLLSVDMHLPVPFEDVIEFHGTLQDMGQGRFTCRHDGVGNAAAKSRCLWYLIGVQEFAEDGPVDDAFMGACGNIAD